ncbi:hypothetical protein GGD63_005114 [Bradyrhizobium sp. cir1]|nr:hypothetical protein [Bradyrhizobium sp. cir1]
MADPGDGPLMTDRNDKNARQDSRRGPASRDDRLKSALRENLKRRKLQARERAAITEPSQNDDGSLNEGTAGKTGD